ncbi:hypothetical protein PDESU_06500 [Pontiella desulfatans]|uniref:Uncharacterized protein n=1 Tax=Pontiella desulfatans TaxID=2750659 RepID=A0A6C2UCI7_PONDE|nr:hypothetical protein [Pontiella desulfatans]VGO17898.1 hypothetical protein PDESU_06500 [Pontiella desulfatans]
MEKVELTSEIEAVLVAYSTLQQEERVLRERKHALQEKLKAHLRGEAKRVWFPEVGGERLKISYRSVPQVEYDEEVLRSRLGARYESILEPDLRKLKAELPNLGSELAPLLGRIGSPSPEKVKEALHDKTMTADEFKGAFTKTMKEYISVAHVPSE